MNDIEVPLYNTLDPVRYRSVSVSNDFVGSALVPVQKRA